MSRHYHTLFKVAFKHRYYTTRGEATPDFRYVPSPDTQQLMRNYRMNFRLNSRTEANGFVISYESGGNVAQPARSITGKSLKFTFFLTLQNPDFYHYSVLPGGMKYGEVFYFTNSAADTLTPALVSNGTTEYVPVRGRVFSLESTSNASTITVTPFGGGAAKVVTLDSPPIPQDNPVTYYRSRVNLSDFPKGRYTLTHGSQSFDYYLDEDALQEKVFAVVEIFHNASTPFVPGTPQDFEANFQNRIDYWKYFIFDKDSGRDLRVVHNTSSPIPFANPTTPTTQEQETIDAVQVLHPDTEVSVIKSAIPIFFTDERKSKLELRLVSSTTALIPHLANPSSKQLKAEVIVVVHKSNTTS